MLKSPKDKKGFIADSIHRAGGCHSLQSFFGYLNRFAYDEEVRQFDLISRVQSQNHFIIHSRGIVRSASEIRVCLPPFLSCIFQCCVQCDCK